MGVFDVIPIGGLSNHFLDDLVVLANLYDKLILKQNNDLAFFEDIHNPKFRKEAAKRPRSVRI